MNLKFYSVVVFFTLLVIPTGLWAQDDGANNVPGQPATVEDGAVSTQTTQKILDLQEDIIARQDLHNDSSLKYSRTLYAICVELMRDKIALAQKNGDTAAAQTGQAELDSLKADRDAEWIENIPILQDKYDIADLEIDALTAMAQQKLDHPEMMSSKASAVLVGLQDFLGQFKPLLDQRLVLEKQLITARNAEDFAAASALYVQLKDIRAKMREVVRTSRNDLLQKLEKSLDTEPQNL
jgi:hypothetical protein